MCSDGSGTGTSGSQTKTSLSYTPDASISHLEGSAKSYTTAEENVNGNGMGEPVQEHVVTQQKGAAKIHECCFGIPFGECAMLVNKLLIFLHVEKAFRLSWAV